MSHAKTLALLAAAISATLSLGACTLPMKPDQPAYQTFAPAPGPGTDVAVVPILMGSAKAPRCAAAGEATCFGAIEIVHTAYLLRHPRGNVLVDAGLSTRGREDLGRYPLVRRMMLDYEAKGAGSLKAGLAAAGNPPIAYVVLTHVHWDHTSGLRDLDHPRVLMAGEDVAFGQSQHGDDSPVMYDHLDGADVTTVNWDGPPVENFEASHDLFGDGSVVLVPMPGHTPGSLGVLVTRVHGKRLLFIGDTAWSMDAVAMPSHKMKLMSRFADHDPDVLSEALWRLHHLHARDPDLVMVPTHDGAAFAAVSALE